MVQRTTTSDWPCRFIIRPNRSSTWRQNQVLFLLLAVVCLTIASAFAVAGFWPILPFAGLELAVVGTCMYLVSASGRDIEVINIGDTLVCVEKGRRRPEHRWEFDRNWARVALLQATHKWYPTRLVIRSHGRQVRVGEFLTDEERAQLARDLEQALVNSRTDPPTSGV